MNLKAFFGIISVYEAIDISIWSLFQAEIIPENVFRVLEQFPVLAVAIVVVLVMRRQQREDAETARKNQKEDAALRRQQQKEDSQETRQWLESLLAMQRQLFTESQQANHEITNDLVSRISLRQNEIIEVIIKELTKQITIIQATVAEAAKIDDVVHDLMDRLEAGRRGKL